MTGLGTYLFADYWYQWVRPGWETTMEPTTYLPASAAFALGTVLFSTYIAQPIAYNFAFKQLTAEDAYANAESAAAIANGEATSDDPQVA